jgi:ABC-type transport system involved in cytochrome c biogenesis permease component
MTSLPIVDRELRVSARRRSTYWNRLGVALAGLLIGGWAMLIFWRRPSSELGMGLFAFLSVIAFGYAILAGIFTTADCLSEEKRDGTLGLLFLTDLKGYDIVLGKLAATSLNAFYGMLALFPILAIPLLLGGVTVEEFWRVVLVCVNNLFFSLAVGMFCSSISRDERKAMLLAFLILLLFAAGPAVTGMVLQEWFGVPMEAKRTFVALFITNPVYGCFGAFHGFRGAPPVELFYPNVICVHALGWCFLTVASVIVPRTWQDRAESSAALRRRRWWQWASFGDPGARAALRRRLLDQNPFYWLASRGRLKHSLVWAFLGFGAVIWGLGLRFDPRNWREAPSYVITAILVHTVLKLWLAGEACKRFALDRRSGALELLLSTPMQVGEIVRGQLLALLKQFAGPALVVVGVDFIFLMTYASDKDWVSVWLAGTAVFIADLVALSWVGMWMGLRSRGVNRATAASVVRVMVLPWVIWGMVLTTVALLLEFVFRSRSLPKWLEVDFPSFPIWFWFLISMANNLLLGTLARVRLLTRFRQAALQRAARPA